MDRDSVTDNIKKIVEVMIALDGIDYRVAECSVTNRGPHTESSERVFKCEDSAFLYIPCIKHISIYEEATKRGWEEVIV